MLFLLIYIGVIHFQEKSVCKSLTLKASANENYSFYIVTVIACMVKPANNMQQSYLLNAQIKVARTGNL